MKEIFGIPVIESEEAGDVMFLIPQVRPVVFEPAGGFASDADRVAVTQKAIADAYIQAAKRGEVGMIKNVEL